MMTKLVSWITVLAGTMKPIRQTSTKRLSLGLPFGRLTDEQKKKTTVTAYFYGTGLDIKGYVDPNHGIYKVFLDGKEVPYQDGMGNASTIDGKKYFSGRAAQRQGNQTLVSLKGLDENLHAVTLQLDPDRNDLSQNIGIQVDQFITRGEGANSTARQISSSLSLNGKMICPTLTQQA